MKRNAIVILSLLALLGAGVLASQAFQGRPGPPPEPGFESHRPPFLGSSAGFDEGPPGPPPGGYENEADATSRAEAGDT